MDIESAQSILVIILSITLALFLAVAITVLIKIIKLVDALKRIADKAEKLVDKAEHIGDVFQKTAGPLAVGRLFTHLADAVLHRDKSKTKSRKG